MTSNCEFMFIFELSGPNLVSVPNFSSIPLQMADFSLFFGAKSSQVPSVILLPWQQLKIYRTGLPCKMCLKGVSLKSESFSLIP